jgi:hypothetical protein
MGHTNLATTVYAWERLAASSTINAERQHELGNTAAADAHRDDARRWLDAIAELKGKTYAAFHVDNLRTGKMHQIGIISGDHALGMLNRSADPRRLAFVELPPVAELAELNSDADTAALLHPER